MFLRRLGRFAAIVVAEILLVTPCFGLSGIVGNKRQPCTSLNHFKEKIAKEPEAHDVESLDIRTEVLQRQQPSGRVHNSFDFLRMIDKAPHKSINFMNSMASSVDKKEVVSSRYQTNPCKSWLFMCIYWLIGWSVGYRSLYITLLKQQIISLHPYFLIALVITLVCQSSLLTRFSSFGRKPNIFSTLIFALCNGTAETFLFFATYDFGRNFLFGLTKVDNSYLLIRRLIGFCVFSIYSALIHDKFWLPCAFPKHIKDDATKFTTHALPLLTIVSNTWLAMYDLSNDIIGPCILHAIFNAWAMFVIALPLPLKNCFESLRKLQSVEIE